MDQCFVFLNVRRWGNIFLWLLKIAIWTTCRFQFTSTKSGAINKHCLIVKWRLYGAPIHNVHYSSVLSKNDGMLMLNRGSRCTTSTDTTIFFFSSRGGSQMPSTGLWDQLKAVEKVLFSGMQRKQKKTGNLNVTVWTDRGKIDGDRLQYVRDSFWLCISSNQWSWCWQFVSLWECVVVVFLRVGTKGRGERERAERQW